MEATMPKLIAAIHSHCGLSDEKIMQAGKNAAASRAVSGFSDYSDTGKFYDDNEELIWELLEQQANKRGDGIHQLIGSLRTKYDNLTTFKNLLSWFVLKEVGRWLQEEKTKAWQNKG